MPKGANDDPIVKSAPRVDEPSTGRIEIGVDKGRAVRNRPENPGRYWDSYFKTNDKSADDLWEIVYLLRSEKKLDHVEAALRAYLIHRTKNAEPWMYEMLAVTIEMRKGPAAEVKTLLGYAAYQAKQGKNPTHLVSVADLLLLRGITEKIGPPGNQTDVGELLDAAAELVPHRPQPAMMLIKLAVKTKDAKRMESSLERLLSLGWAGWDDEVRADARKQAMALIKTLREEGKDSEGSELLSKLPAIESRDVYAKLTWVGEADIDLIVDEPLGATAKYLTPRTVFGGSLVKNGYGNHPEEVYVCPRGFSGDYTFRFDTIFTNPAKPVTKATLEVITHEGTADEKRVVKVVDLAKPEPLVIHLEGGRRTKVLPLLIVPRAMPGTPAANAAAKAKAADPKAAVPKAKP